MRHPVENHGAEVCEKCNRFLNDPVHFSGEEEKKARECQKILEKAYEAQHTPIPGCVQCGTLDHDDCHYGPEGAPPAIVILPQKYKSDVMDWVAAELDIKIEYK